MQRQNAILCYLRSQQITGVIPFLFCSFIITIQVTKYLIQRNDQLFSSAFLTSEMFHEVILTMIDPIGNVFCAPFPDFVFGIEKLIDIRDDGS